VNLINRILKSALRVVLASAVLFSAILFATWIYIAQPTFQSNTPTLVSVEAARLKGHVMALISVHSRNHLEIANLDRAARYIEGHFRRAGAHVTLQNCSIGLRPYRNVIGSFGADPGRTKLIIGAHYDCCVDTPGADDNASGVAGLIELAYLFGKNPPDREIELVAYTLEEPPYFGTEYMGSHHHARATAASGRHIEGVIVLEMIGYFSIEAGSQDFPSVYLSLMYPDEGDFIAVVSNLAQRPFTRAVKIAMKNATDVPVYSLNAPSMLPGVDLSDHRNYWPHGINAVMITDTAFYRNKAYHTRGDTPERLDYEQMARVTAAVYEAARTIAR
jgi:Zn-dependent M28 family amino/carboxypeptidase